MSAPCPHCFTMIRQGARCRGCARLAAGERVRNAISELQLAAAQERLGLGPVIAAEVRSAIAVLCKLETTVASGKRRSPPPCGRGDSIPRCLGSAAVGPSGCTCR